MLIETIRSLPAYKRLVDDIRNSREVPVLGLPRAARVPALAALYSDLSVPLLFITDRIDHALTALDELSFWLKNVRCVPFPEPNPLFYEPAAWGNTIRRERLSAMTSLAVYHIPGSNKPTQAPVLIAPVRAIMTRTLPRRDFLKKSKILRIGQKVAPEVLQRAWVEIGYQAEDVVLEPGQFSRRGGILDIWPPSYSSPARLDFFGDELDTLRRFDPSTQRTIERIEELLVTPAREVLPGRAQELEFPVSDVNEFHLPLIHPTPASLLDYLPTQGLVIIDDLDGLRVTASEIEEQAVKLRNESIQEKTLKDDFPIPYVPWSDLEDSLSTLHWLDMGLSGKSQDGCLGSVFQPGPRFAGRLKPFTEYLNNCCRDGEYTLVISRQGSRLHELWNETMNGGGVTSCPEFVEATVSDGFILHLEGEKRLHLLTDSEVFGWERPRPRLKIPAMAEAPESIYADLRPGDWVVHVDYGIGRFNGLVKRTLEGLEREFLCVEYDGGDQLYVPVHQADRLSRYIGSGNEPPSPTRLGTQEWSNAQERVREAVRQVAGELLELYASRQMAKGYAFQADTPWQHELEASFPYVETEDQLRALQEVKQDMEAQQPMDRLLCGDVGYGKTEVALRAAFKAVMDGKQVAVLVPTTVLAQQHFDTFRQRLVPYPVEVEMLSRFRLPREQAHILKRLQQGAIDIIIGTHRLIQADVQFKDLGLVIIDEEQRFGVTHKEYLKKLRTEVDVLTLTATPIPRTLYMALTGVRDISTINTPPEERLPVVTHIGPYSSKLVRQSMLRELERGGQIFFVHNRVQTITAMKMHLNKLVPEARIGIAHGQMPEAELANVMHQFSQGQIDTLLCTSIIESGLDIPNANTLIVDRGDTFGLAQLYQLRGRVGRSAQRAYAYFFRHRRKPPTPEGLERLEVIAENTQLGSGYSIAMRDLEMRGAGELLGTRQHGYITSVGFQLYTRLLAQAIREKRKSQGMPDAEDRTVDIKELRPLVSVDLPLDIGIPVEYVPEQNMRLRLYRRLAGLQHESELDEMAIEFADRFGPLPGMLKDLFFHLRVKLYAENCGLASVTVEGDQIVLRYPPLPDGIKDRNLSWLGPDVRSGKNAYWMQFDNYNENWRNRLLEVLSAIIEI